MNRSACALDLVVTPLAWTLALIALPPMLARPAFADVPMPLAAPVAGMPPPPANRYFAPPVAGVFVDLRADNPSVRIDRVTTGGAALPVCVAPCRQALERGGLYVIQGDGIPATSPFLLPDGSDRVTLEVRAGSQPKRLLGGALLVGGAALTLVGFARVSLGGSFQGSEGRRAERTGLIMMGIGVPAAVVGMLLFRSARTSVSSSTGATFTQEQPRAPRRRARPALTLTLTAEGLAF